MPTFRHGRIEETESKHPVEEAQKKYIHEIETAKRLTERHGLRYRLQSVLEVGIL